MYSCCIIVQGRGIVTGVTESQCRESVKEEYKGITLYLGIFHMPDPPPGNEYSDHGESSGNVWLKGKASRSHYCSLHGSEAGLPGKNKVMMAANGEGGGAPEMEQWRQGMQELLARVIELERGIAQSDRRERELLARVEELRAAARGQGDARNKVKEISESKAVMGLKVLGEDRAAYKEWHTKFVNVMAQLRPGIRPILKAIEMFRDEPWTEEEFDLACVDDRYRGKFDEWNQDMWWVLIEKTTGEALLRVKGVEQGQGMEAYKRLHQWFGKQTDMGLAELRQRVIRPNQAKREEDIARCIEEWNESLMELKRVDPDYKDLPDAYQVAALRGMLTGKYRDHIDMKLAEKDMKKDELLGEIRRYAVLKRQQRKSPDAMDVDEVTQRRKGNSENVHRMQPRGEWPWIQACSGPRHEEEWGNAWGYEEEDNWGQIEEVGKGKGKGKAFRGECYTCGKWGHSARNCPTMGKGFSGACYNCGIVGHSAKYCPNPPRAGSKGKGKGKREEWERSMDERERKHEVSGIRGRGRGSRRRGRGRWTRYRWHLASRREQKGDEMGKELTPVWKASERKIHKQRKRQSKHVGSTEDPR